MVVSAALFAGLILAFTGLAYDVLDRAAELLAAVEIDADDPVV
jgi:hypothetical protein